MENTLQTIHSLLQVRMAVDTKDWKLLQALSRSASPIVQQAAYEAADEMEATGSPLEAPSFGKH